MSSGFADAQREWCTDDELKQIDFYREQCRMLICELTEVISKLYVDAFRPGRMADSIASDSRGYFNFGYKHKIDELIDLSSKWEDLNAQIIYRHYREEDVGRKGAKQMNLFQEDTR